VDEVAVEDVDFAVKWVLERGVNPGDAGYVRVFFPGFQLATGQMAVGRVLMARARGRGKKRLIRLQVHPYRDSLTGIITPVSLYLRGVSAVIG